MKWTRKTDEFQYADYISEDGRFHISDATFHHRKEYESHIAQGGRKTDWWALLDNGEIVGWAHTVKALKETAETL